MAENPIKLRLTNNNLSSRTAPRDQGGEETRHPTTHSSRRERERERDGEGERERETGRGVPERGTV